MKKQKFLLVYSYFLKLILGAFLSIGVIFVLLISPFVPVSAAGADDFVTTWNSGADGVIQIPIVRVDGWNGVSTADYHFSVDWGDGSSDNYVGGGLTPSHTYANLDTEYDIRISGTFPAMTFSPDANGLTSSISNDLAKKLTKLKQWGTGKWQTTSFMFYKCSNLEADYADSPDTSIVTDMSMMFDGASKFNGAVNFDTENVVNMRSMFFNASAFNHPVNFDTRSVTSMYYMFGEATSFNQPINFNSSSVTDMAGMFYRATSFNQPVNLRTENVVNMRSMFSRASSFNQPINFNTSKVSNFNEMFSNASSFNQDVSHLDFRAATSLTDSIDFVGYTNLSTINNDRFIRALMSQLGPSIPKAIASHGLTYCLASTQHDALVAAGWAFYDTRDCTNFEPNALSFSSPLEIPQNAP